MSAADSERTAESIDLSVVVPVLDEEASLEQLDGELRRALGAVGGRTEIVYVDDGSSDGSPAVLARLSAAAADGVPTRVARLRRNFGQSTALAVGFRLAHGRVLVPLDADGQNNPADIPRLVERLDDGFEVISGWRRRRQDRALSRRFPSWAANRLISALSGVRLHDHGCTLKAYRGDLVRRLRLHGEMHRFIPVFLAPMGARITELEVDHRPRTHGSSKYGGDRVLKVLLDLATIRFVSRYAGRPMHFFGQAALAFLAGVIATLSAMVAFKYGWLRVLGFDYRASFIQTPLPALAGTFLIGAVIALFFGVLAEMLVRLHIDLKDPTEDAVERVLDSRQPPG